MTIHYPVRTRIARLTTIRRERLLPTSGEVLVAAGEQVEPSDVVARCQLRGRIRVVDVGKTLGVSQDRAAKLVIRSVGDTVRTGDVIAESGGQFGKLKRRCRTPVDGQVVALRKGWVLIETSPSTFDLRAHLRGEVADVLPDRGVAITSVGTVIQGAWGSGGEAEGTLKVVVDRPHKPLLARYLDASCQGTLVVGGRIMDRHALEHAVKAKVRAIIAGSVAAELCSLLQSLPYPVLITEGFGKLPMSHEVFTLLRNSAGREAMLSAYAGTRLSTKRPEVLIPLRVEGELPPEEPDSLSFRVGTQVRGLRAPFLGVTGIITDLPALPQVVESGARLAVADMEQLKDGKTVSVPLANLELIY